MISFIISAKILFSGLDDADSGVGGASGPLVGGGESVFGASVSDMASGSTVGEMIGDESSSPPSGFNSGKGLEGGVERGSGAGSGLARGSIVAACSGVWIVIVSGVESP